MTIVPAWFRGVRGIVAVVVILSLAGGAVAVAWLALRNDPPRAIVRVVKAGVSHKPFGATEASLLTARESPISIEPNAELVTNDTGVADLVVTLSGLTTPAPTSCRINSGTTVNTLPNGPADSLLLTLVTGKVFCKHPELERTNRPRISFPGIGELIFERAEIKATFQPGQEARIDVAKGIVAFDLLEGTAEGKPALTIDIEGGQGLQLVRDSGAWTPRLELAQFTSAERAMLAGLGGTLPTITPPTTPPDLRIQPTSADVVSGASQLFSATGGTPPYSFDLSANNSGGSIDAGSGAYTAGSASGIEDAVRVTDADGTTALASVTINPALRIRPASVVVVSGTSHTFSATGGVGPYTFEVTSNNSGGSFEAGAGVYTAGATSGVTDTVRVTDADGNTALATVTVNPPLQIRPTSAVVVSGTSQSFGATGGAPPYTFSLTIKDSGGSIDAGSGAYTAGPTGRVTDTARVTDAAGNTALATVTVNPALRIRPASAVVVSGTSHTFSATGGVGAYTFELTSNNSGASVDPGAGVYNAGPTSGATDTVRVTDADGNAALATVTVNPPLQIRPISEVIASGTSHTFSATGGVGAYTFELTSNNSGASVDPGAGVYTAGPTSGITDTVRVTDGDGNAAFATVTVNPALQIRPTSKDVESGTDHSFVATGGVGAYTFELTHNPSGGSIDPGTGVYTSGTTTEVTDTVRVTDADGNTADATAIVLVGGGGGGGVGPGGDGRDPPLKISFPSVTVLPGATLTLTVFAGDRLTFGATGGVDPYTFELSSNNSRGSIDPGDGIYTAGTTSGVIDTVRVTDVFGRTDEANVRVNPAFDILPPWFTVDGGGGASSGGGFALVGAAGQPDASPRLAGGEFTLRGGVMEQ